MANEKILTKLAAIMEEVEYIQKDAKNAHGGYKYASEKAIKETLHPVLSKYRVVFQLNVQTPVIIPDTKTQYLPVEYHFWDAESGEGLSGNFVGSAHIRDEKAHYAAITGAIKYILTTTFLIPTGDDPEKDEDEKKQRKAETTMRSGGGVSDSQWKYIQKLRAEKVVPDGIDADLTAWASRSNQTGDEASGFIETLKALPKRMDRAEIVKRITAGEPKVYEFAPAISKAREKYVGTVKLEDAPDDKLQAYLDHIIAKWNEKKGAA